MQNDRETQIMTERRREQQTYNNRDIENNRESENDRDVENDRET